MSEHDILALFVILQLAAPLAALLAIGGPTMLGRPVG